MGPFLSRLSVRAVDGDLLTAAVTYVDGLDQWTQEFQARRLTLDDVAATLHRTGFHPEGPVPGEPDWLTGIRSEPD